VATPGPGLGRLQLAGAQARAGRLAMAVCAVLALELALESENGNEKGRGSGDASEEGQASTLGSAGTQDARHRRLAMVGARSVHGGHVQSRCYSLRRFLEHVAGSEVGKVGR